MSPPDLISNKYQALPPIDHIPAHSRTFPPFPTLTTFPLTRPKKSLQVNASNLDLKPAGSDCFSSYLSGFDLAS